MNDFSDNNNSHGQDEPKIRKKRKSLVDAEKPSVSEQSAPDPHATTQSADIAARLEAEFAKETKARLEMEAAQSVNDLEAEAMFQHYIDSQVNTILPRIPEDPMWRYCWVTTETTFGDNVATRLRGKWTFVKWGEIEGLTQEIMNNRSGTQGDIITFNEMALMKMPRVVWEKIMKHNHHTQPLQQEAGIRELLQSKVMDATKANNTEYMSADAQALGKETKKANFKGI